MVEIGDIHLEVLRDDLLRNMGKPVSYLENTIRRIVNTERDEIGST